MSTIPLCSLSPSPSISTFLYKIYSQSLLLILWYEINSPYSLSNLFLNPAKDYTGKNSCWRSITPSSMYKTLHMCGVPRMPKGRNRYRWRSHLMYLSFASMQYSKNVREARCLPRHYNCRISSQGQCCQLHTSRFPLRRDQFAGSSREL